MSGESTSLYAALLEAQRVMPDPPRTGTNPHFRSDYVTLSDLLDVALPVLNDQDLVLVQAPQVRDGEDVLVTRIIHAPTGEWEESATRLYMSKTDSQAQGSAITYARRYALMSMLALVGEDDDDGNAASASENRRSGERAAPREFDPGRDLLPGAIEVKTVDDAEALRREEHALLGDNDLATVEDYVCLHVFGVPVAQLNRGQTASFWKRLANMVVTADQLAGGGDFPPPTLEQVAAAYGATFDGVVVALSGSETPSDLEAEATTTPEGEEA